MEQNVEIMRLGLLALFGLMAIAIVWESMQYRMVKKMLKQLNDKLDTINGDKANG